MSSLPTGTVTFLFTDIEGSTRLWEEHPDPMREALARHDEILGSVISGSGGHVVKSTGDGAHAVFDRAESAVQAAITMQSFFQREQFDGVGRLRVRMALHTGEADERRGDYFGSAVNRAARLLGTGHGGQILVSAATKELLSDTDSTFADLGEHRLRDLARPEHIYQILGPGLPAEFPALASLDGHPNNLPVQLTSFIGRTEELRLVGKLLAEARLVTLSGIGGAGKTRLALQAVAEVIDSFQHGAWVVELASVSDPGLVVNQAAMPFGVRDQKTDSGRVLVDVLSDYLVDKELLLVLDNCEHVLESAAALAETMLTRCPELRILATSRELLGIPGEVVYPVPPLGLPAEEAIELSDGEAVRLFVERAAQVQPQFRLSAENASAVAELTRRLDGLPLAIELTASRANLLTPDQMLARLDDQYRLITSSRRDGGRHATLDAAMDWSYELLSQPEKSLLRQLAVFSGGWPLEAAEAVCRIKETDVLDLMGRLVDKSLVDVFDLEGANRYRLLEPVRQYAVGKLGEADEERLARHRHAEYFTELAEASESNLRGPQQGIWIRQMDEEHDNVRGALGWALDAGEDDLALRLVGAMGWFWWLRGYWKEAQRWFQRVYEQTEDADRVLRGRAVYKVAGLEVQRARPAEVTPLIEKARQTFKDQGDKKGLAWTSLLLADSKSGSERGAPDAEQGLELARESVELFSAEDDEWGLAYAVFTLGNALKVSQGEDEGFSRMRESIDALVALGDQWTAAWFSLLLGYALTVSGRFDDAEEVIELSLELVEGTEDRWVIPHCKSRLAVVKTMTGQLEDAKVLFEEALPIHRQIGDENCTAFVHTYLGEVHSNEGAFTAARDHLAKGLEGYRDLQNPHGIANGLRRMGWLAMTAGDHERAARLLGAAEAIRAELGGSIAVHDQRRMDAATESLEAHVGEQTMRTWWESGMSMSRGEAITYALDRLDN